MRKLMNKDQKITKIVLLTLCSVILIVHAFLQFGTSLSEIELSKTQGELENMAESSIKDVRNVYENMITSLTKMATIFHPTSFADQEMLFKQLVFLKEITVFDNIVIADEKGNTLDSAGQKTNIKKREYFQSAMSGETVISGVLDSQMVQEREIQVLAVPIQNQGGISGILFGILNIDTLNQVIDEIYMNHIYVQIVDSEGNYITRFKTKDVLSTHKNVWEDLKEYKYRMGSFDKINEDILNGKEGHFSFRYGKEERVSYYAPLGVNRYYIFVTTNSKYIKDHIDKTNAQVILMSAELVIAFLVLILGLYLYSRKIHQEIMKSHEEVLSSEEMMRIAISQSEQTVFEYKLENKEFRTKAGKQTLLFPETVLTNVPESVLERDILEREFRDCFRKIFDDIREKEICETEVKCVFDGNEQWFRIVMKNLFDEKKQIVNTVGIIEDISEKKQQEELLIEKQRIQDALCADALMSCKVDLENEKVLEADGESLSCSVSYQQYLKEYILKNVVENERKSVILKFSKEYLLGLYDRGNDTEEITFQMYSEGKTIWVSCMVYLMVEQSKNKQVQALLVLNDIDEKKQEELRLKERAERDGLTGLYNAVTMKAKVNQFLQSLWALEGNHIFMLMDLDCFKQVNDTFGHQYGDQVLKEVSVTLKKTFRQNDLIGRMGGDEFAIMILNVSDFSTVEHTIQELLEHLHKRYEQDDKIVEVSASLGIVCAPQYGTTFEELYKKSDQMLYEVKRSTKNGYYVYSGEGFTYE